MIFCFNQFSTPARQVVVVLLAILLAATGLFAGVQTTAQAAAGQYAVQRGDTLTRIAARFGTSVPTLQDSNSAKYPCLAAQSSPVPNELPTQYVRDWVGRYDGLHWANPACLQAGWVLTALVAGDTDAVCTALCSIVIPVPQTSEGLATPSTYTVQSGDTLTRIAARFGTNVAAILDVNELANPNLLYFGQTLILPSGSVPVPQQPQVQALATRIYGTPDFVAAVEATLTWLAENDPDALARVGDYVDTISVETRPGYGGRAYSTNNGAWCETTTILADLMEMLLSVVHEASHCYQNATQEYMGYAAGEAVAYGEQIDFMRRHGYRPQHIALYEQARAHWAAQAGLN